MRTCVYDLANRERRLDLFVAPEDMPSIVGAQRVLAGLYVPLAWEPNWCSGVKRFQ